MNIVVTVRADVLVSKAKSVYHLVNGRPVVDAPSG
jgi:hypothetical protein